MDNITLILDGYEAETLMGYLGEILANDPDEVIGSIYKQLTEWFNNEAW